MKIAVLLTCYNRKDKTLACLKSLSKNSSSVIVYITDDASTDGTSLAIRQYYSEDTSFERNYLFHYLDKDTARQMEEVRLGIDVSEQKEKK